MKNGKVSAREQRTARLTILIDPRKKAVLEDLCAAEDVTPSQLVRGLIRRYIEERLGKPWTPDPADDVEPASDEAHPLKRAAAKRRRASS